MLKRGEVLEFQFPVRATREMKGPATQQPECDKRVAGDGPCPVAQAGDHFQIAFAVGGHGGSKSYVTPYVGLFAAKAGSPRPAGVDDQGALDHRGQVHAEDRQAGQGRGHGVVRPGARPVTSS